jgi:succinate-acetate transporter protein
MIGFILLWMALITLIFLICSLRVNICFVVIFFTLLLALVFLTVAYWLLAADFVANAAVAGKMLVVSHVHAVDRNKLRGLTSALSCS